MLDIGLRNEKEKKTWRPKIKEAANERRRLKLYKNLT